MNIEDEIKRHIFDDILFGEEDNLSESVSFQESGILDSIGFLGLITFVEEKFGIEIAEEELMPENFDTLQRIVRFVQQKLDENTAC